VFSATRSKAHKRLKRLIDVFISMIALGAFSLVFPLLALLIRWSTGGSVIFSQDRVGFRGKMFRIHKLRTMVLEAESGGMPVWAEPDDRRVTGVGRFLRRTRLDEVPQFWDVLRGNMSVVGPRPERPFFVEKLRREIPHYDWRHSVHPGITGWAQVNQGYAASSEESFRKLELDFYYIKNRSFPLDLKILFRTIGVILGRKGAR
jgi:lipopolysaccharide/colanic/teichoic acid biosynthesis glycosyltransferase